MFNGLMSMAALAGAVLCALAAVTLFAAFRRQRRLASAALRADGEPHGRLDERTQRIVRLLAAENGGAITPQRTRRGHSEPMGAYEQQLSQEIASGLRIICQASPEVALHDGNLALLVKLRELTGAGDFPALCRQLAVVLNDHDPRYQELALGLETGHMSWNQFVSELRTVPMGTAQF